MYERIHLLVGCLAYAYALYCDPCDALLRSFYLPNIFRMLGNVWYEKGRLMVLVCSRMYSVCVYGEGECILLSCCVCMLTAYRRKSTASDGCFSLERMRCERDRIQQDFVVVILLLHGYCVPLLIQCELYMYTMRHMVECVQFFMLRSIHC